mmetsp:Transcript_109569/g.316799  ORF Transcript_109569/g.316799 Transcript_109569/m.316799 type:complete len:538 (+) Transcript_109569:155-1768(+)
MAESSTLAVASRPNVGVQDITSVLDQKVLETPRTVEACRRLGLVIEDLQIRSFESFYIPGDLKLKQQKRFEHFEKKRRERLAQVLAERAKVIAEQQKKGEVPGVQSAQFLSMLESLFEKEAKRLEVDLKGQLRSHYALVQENEEQLRKEEELQRRLEHQEMRRQASRKYFEESASKAQDKRNSKFEKNQQIMAKLDEDFRLKEQQFKQSLMAEEERLARFEEARRQESSDKASVFKERVEEMKRKTEMRIVEKREEGEEKLRRLGERIAQVERRREDEQTKRMLQSEDQHLHIMDVIENKSRLDRVNEHRRGELKEQVESNIERVETLLALKEQLLDQRKARNMKAEASKASRGLNLRRDCLPGPGQYEAVVSAMTEAPGVKMGSAKVPGMLDEAIKATAANPAPGSYDSSVLANGQKVSQALGNGGKFGDGDRRSFLDEAQKQKEFVPAPGRYEVKTTLDSKAPKMARPKFDDPGLVADKKSAKSFPTWSRPTADTPGPAGYTVDDYMRKEVLRRAQRSLPNLTRDMLRPGKLNVK